MIGQREALRMFGCEVFDPDGHRIGIVGQLFIEDETEQPAWVTVQTGLFGTNESFVPLEGAAFDGDTLTVAVGKDAVRLAPRVCLDQGDLPPAQERALYLHYGMSYGVAPDGSAEEYVEAVRLRLRRWVAAT
ncbi:PRC-barrel domain-containing protein [Saccharopolyspora hordei]|mgnify:CR=1 FL=1|uniref:Sporulation protein YlmC with PRC-barrel domain n=1 Tax=Saccharopolyspora hordei TaxID=1838 RepID=A0A853AEL1_9PSEU|nr:PRC-barrel domain-containing protein [Saccharopolyspora hordei]NYI82256.1 sporulation protein YlmC with PRC-barrel domain [Saccharopolyspora hordei]